MRCPFEAHGFRYTAYTIHPDGTVASNSYHTPAPFPPGVHRRCTDALRDFAAAIALGYARYLDICEIQAQTERKSAFLASMSHELRTPMNAIIGFMRMVLKRAGDALPDRQKGNLEKVVEAGNRLLGLINDLLDLSKIEAGRMDIEVKRFSVETLARSCCAEVEPLVKPGVKLSCDVADSAEDVETDEGRVRQIVTNLLSNAIKFTEQGEVAVHVHRESDDLFAVIPECLYRESIVTLDSRFRGNDSRSSA